MRLAQMRTLLPVIEESIENAHGAYLNPVIYEDAVILDGLTPFKWLTGSSNRNTRTVVLDRQNEIVREYDSVL